MKLELLFLRRPAAMASLLLAMAAPATVVSAERSTQTVAPVGTPIQQVNYNCPNGDCYGGSGGGWNGRGWGGRGCLFGNCHHGFAHGYAFVRPPAVYPLNRVPNTYHHYWSQRLATGQTVTQTGLQYPMVYQPTDTTQLGFYYQSVPRWHYRPEMLPAAPAPYWPMGAHGGFGWGGGVVVSNGTAVGPSTTTSPVTPAPVQTQQVAPPPPPPEGAANVPEPDAAYFPERIRR